MHGTAVEALSTTVSTLAHLIVQITPLMPPVHPPLVSLRLQMPPFAQDRQQQSTHPFLAPLTVELSGRVTFLSKEAGL
jgi:hypothetical protein